MKTVTGIFASVIILLHCGDVLPGEKTVDIGTITVSAGQEIVKGTTVEVFNRPAIESAETTDVSDFLERLPSIKVNTGKRGEHLLQLRGFDQTEILILVDGIPMEVPFDGVVDLGKIPSAMIDRIEVVKGAGPIVYGPGGLGGAVNLITRSPIDTPVIEFSTGGSFVNEAYASLLHSYSFGKFGYALYTGFTGVEDFPLSGDYRATTNQPAGKRIGSGMLSGFGGGKLEWRPSDEHLLTLSGSVINGRYDVPPSTVSARPTYWKFDPWRAANVALMHSGRYFSDRLKIEETAFVAPFANTLKSYDNAGYNSQASRQAFDSYYDDLVSGAFVRANVYFAPSWIERLEVSMWAGGRYESHEEKSTTNPNTTDYSHWLVTVAPEVDWWISKKIILRTSAQLDSEVPEKFSGIISPKNQFSGGPLLSLSVAPADWLDIELAGARRVRFPTLKERFADAFGQRVPNPNLGAEKAWHSSLDFTVRPVENFSLKLGGFDSEVQGIIVRTAIGGGQFQLQNASRARLAGFEAEADYKAGKWCEMRIGYQYLYAKRLNASYPDSQLQYRPEHKANLYLELKPAERLSIINEAVITGPRPFQDIDTYAWGRLATAVNWDVRIKGTVTKWFDAWLSVNNLTDANNTSEYGYPEPGRTVWLGLSARYIK